MRNPVTGLTMCVFTDRLLDSVAAAQSLPQLGEIQFKEHMPWDYGAKEQQSTTEDLNVIPLYTPIVRL